MVQSSSTSALLPQIKAAGLRTFHTRLMGWYQTHGRHELPWRQTSDPYPIWVSEVMLQQTQVATVLARFYHPFLERFPTIQHLATAPRETVMKAWEGLGYYRRAGFLHETAKRVVRSELSVFSMAPTIGHNSLTTHDSQLTTLLSLPGIGRNTAHAILAFAHRQPVAILEANVKRVVARIFALATPSDAQLWAGAEMLLNTKHPFDHNQAMMDLGAMICTPKAPNCHACPANIICKGRANPEVYPTPKVKKKAPTRWIDIAVRMDKAGRLYLEKRSDALLGGLYGFPQSPSSSGLSRGSMDARNKCGHDEIGKIVHIYSHFRLEGRVMLQQATPSPRALGWYTREEIRALPLSKVDHKVLELVDARHSAAPKAQKPRPSRKHR